MTVTPKQEPELKVRTFTKQREEFFVARVQGPLFLIEMGQNK
jgi:hypothetical protein